jgi:hypothetical protein
MIYRGVELFREALPDVEGQPPQWKEHATECVFDLDSIARFTRYSYDDLFPNYPDKIWVHTHSDCTFIIADTMDGFLALWSARKINPKIHTSEHLKMLSLEQPNDDDKRSDNTNEPPA